MMVTEILETDVVANASLSLVGIAGTLLHVLKFVKMDELLERKFVMPDLKEDVRMIAETY